MKKSKIKVFSVLFLSLLLNSALGLLSAQEEDTQNYDADSISDLVADKLGSTEQEDSSVIIINNNNNNSQKPSQNQEALGDESEKWKDKAGKRKDTSAKLDTLAAAYYHFGYGSIQGEANLGSVPGISESSNETRTGYLNFATASAGLSVAIGKSSVFASGAYLGGRFILATAGSYPIEGRMYEPATLASDCEDENGNRVVGIGFDTGPYFRYRLWGRDNAGGIGFAPYGTISLLSSSPDVNTPFIIMGAGLMFDIFFTRSFGFSGKLEVLYSRYESSSSDEFRAVGPSFSFGFMWG